MYICNWCKELLELKTIYYGIKGWLHKGGNIYVQRCSECGVKNSAYPYIKKCPSCGGEMIDDHCVLPVKI